MPAYRFLIPGLLSLVMSTGLLIKTPDATASCQQSPVDQDEMRLQFKSFYQVEWPRIIEYYAEQAELSLRFVDLPPTGTFDYQSERWMSLKEGLDFLNQMLIQSDRVLIQNGELLSLYDVTKGIPDDLIPTVAPGELDDRGKYEVLNCNFDITGLQADELSIQLEPYISDHYRNNMTVIPAANVMIVQEIGYKLRFIRDQILAPAIKSRGRNDWDVTPIELEHVGVEDVLAHAVAIGIQRDSLSNEDGSLTLSISPFDNRILATGNPDQINRFKRIVEAVDVPMGDDELTPREPPFFQRYTVVGEAEKIHQILQTLLAGSPEVRLDYDGDSNQIYLFGRKEDHDKTIEVLNMTEGSSDELAVIWIKESNVDDVIDTVETLFRQTDPESTDGPVLSAESQNRLVVRGKPVDVAMVRKIVEEIDIPFVSRSSESTNRFIQMNGSEMGKTLNLLENMLPTMGLENRIEVIQPDQRNLFYNSDRRLFEIMGATPSADDPADSMGTDSENRDNTNSASPQPNGAGDQSGFNPIRHFGLAGLWQPSLVAGGFITWQQDDETGNGTADTSREQQGIPRDQDDQDSQKQNIPGAPITIRVTEYGIGLESEDFKSLDKIEDLIFQNLDASSGTERIAFFLLKHLDAVEAKKQLESYLGISGGGGGGGGALSGLMGGMLNNALGGEAGGMMSGLLGGGGSSNSDSGVFLTEGPVSIVANVNNYSLAISASPADMMLIEQLIDFMDQPEAMHDPNPVGDTRIIPILYQDVFQVEEMVKQNLSEIVKNAEQQGGGGDPQAQAQAQMLRALLGRGQGGGGTAEDEEPPRASMSVDEKNSALVVTGPKFAYDQILYLVRLVDVPRTGPPNEIVIIPRSNLEPRQLLEMLALQFPDNIEIIEDDQSAETRRTPGTANGAGSGNPAARNNPIPNMEALQQMMRARNQGGRGGGQRGGGQRGETPRVLINPQGGGNQRGDRDR